MSIKLFLPSRLTYLAKSREVFEVTGKTVGECLDALCRVKGFADLLERHSRQGLTPNSTSEARME